MASTAFLSVLSRYLVLMFRLPPGQLSRQRLYWLDGRAEKSCSR
jgi:hypothetical protein